MRLKRGHRGSLQPYNSLANVWWVSMSSSSIKTTGHDTTRQALPIKSAQHRAANHIAEQRDTPEPSRRIQQIGERALMCYIHLVNGSL